MQAEFDQARNAPNTYSISYNPVANFQSRVTREQVRAEFLASRDAVAAMTSEDSGSAYLAHAQARRQRHSAGRHTGQPAIRGVRFRQSSHIRSLPNAAVILLGGKLKLSLNKRGARLS